MRGYPSLENEGFAEKRSYFTNPFTRYLGNPRGWLLGFYRMPGLFCILSLFTAKFCQSARKAYFRGHNSQLKS